MDGRADQYALACVAYQLLTGPVPFERDQGMAVLLAHLSEPPPSLGARRPDLPAAADRCWPGRWPRPRRSGTGPAGSSPTRCGRRSAWRLTIPAAPPPQPITRKPRSSHRRSPGPTAAGTAAVPADPVAAAAPSTTATMIPPVAETARAPAKPAAGQAEARPDAGPPGFQAKVDSVRRSQRVTTVLVAAGGLEPGPGKKAPRAPRSRRIGRAIRRRPVIIAVTAIGIAVIGLVMAITTISLAPGTPSTSVRWTYTAAGARTPARR